MEVADVGESGSFEAIAPQVPGGPGRCGWYFATDGVPRNPRSGSERCAASNGGADLCPRATAVPAAPAAPTPTAPTPAASGTPRRGGQATILQTNDFVSMDPIFCQRAHRIRVYDFLLAWRKNPDGSYAVQPSLAKSWETSPDKIVFHLRDAVTFHDGSPLNADVVVWNLNRMVQNPKSFAKNYLLAVDSQQPGRRLSTDDVQVNLTRPARRS